MCDHQEEQMNQPSKKQFFEYMSDTFGYEFSCERAYELLKDVISEANNNQGTLKEFEELKKLNKQDSKIYRNYLAEKGLKKHHQKSGNILQPSSMAWNFFPKTIKPTRRIRPLIAQALLPTDSHFFNL